LGSGDHGENPWPTCHKVSRRLRRPGSSALKASLYAMVLSQISVWWLFACLSLLSALPWWWQRMTVGDVSARGTVFFKGGIIILLLVGFFVQVCLTHICLCLVVTICVINRLSNQIYDHFKKKNFSQLPISSRPFHFDGKCNESQPCLFQCV
jgi:hypothetical protein